MNGIFEIQISNNALARANSALRSMLTEAPLAVARAANRTMYGMGTDAARKPANRIRQK